MRLPQLGFSVGLLLGFPLLSLAQNTDLPAPRFYGGVGLYSSYYNILGGHYGAGNTVPVQATLGCQLRPRLAVQASFAYSGYAGDVAGTRPDDTGLDHPYSSNYRNRFTTQSVLARYTLTRKPTHHLQFDLLGGFTREHYSFDGVGSYFHNPGPNQPAVATSYDDHSSNSEYLVNVGPGVRYRLGPRFELAYDWLVTLDLRAAEYPRSATSLGLRYRFDFH